jgi:hypothetical protein
MQVSYFETGRYYAPSNLAREWPMPAGTYDREAGLRAFRGMVVRSRCVATRDVLRFGTINGAKALRLDGETGSLTPGKEADIIILDATRDGVAATLLELDQRNVAGEGRRPANVNRVLPINFCGGPDEVIAQLKQARGQIGCGVVDLSF